jgi:hypothetical protein
VVQGIRVQDARAQLHIWPKYRCKDNDLDNLLDFGNQKKMKKDSTEATSLFPQFE